MESPFTAKRTPARSWCELNSTYSSRSLGSVPRTTPMTFTDGDSKLSTRRWISTVCPFSRYAPSAERWTKRTGVPLRGGAGVGVAVAAFLGAPPPRRTRREKSDHHLVDCLALRIEK